MFDEEISTSKPLLEHSTSILGVWVNHVIIHKDITLYYQKQKQENIHTYERNDMQLSQAPTKTLQVASSGRDLHVLFLII